MQELGSPSDLENGAEVFGPLIPVRTLGQTQRFLGAEATVLIAVVCVELHHTKSVNVIE